MKCFSSKDSITWYEWILWFSVSELDPDERCKQLCKAIFCTGMLSTVPQLFRWLCLLCTVENVSFKKTTLLTRSKILQNTREVWEWRRSVSKQYRVFLGRRQSHASSRVPEKVYSLIEDLCDWQRDCQTSDVTPHLFLKLLQFPLTHKTTVPSTNKQIDGQTHICTKEGTKTVLLELQLEKIIPETLFPSSRGLKSNLEEKWNCQQWKTRLGRSSWAEK